MDNKDSESQESLSYNLVEIECSLYFKEFVDKESSVFKKTQLPSSVHSTCHTCFITLYNTERPKYPFYLVLLLQLGNNMEENVFFITLIYIFIYLFKSIIQSLE